MLVFFFTEKSPVFLSLSLYASHSQHQESIGGTSSSSSLSSSSSPSPFTRRARALIVPHGAHWQCAPIAAFAYRHLRDLCANAAATSATTNTTANSNSTANTTANAATPITRVILIAPSHTPAGATGMAFWRCFFDDDANSSCGDCIFAIHRLSRVWINPPARPFLCTFLSPSISHLLIFFPPHTHTHHFIPTRPPIPHPLAIAQAPTAACCRACRRSVSTRRSAV